MSEELLTDDGVRDELDAYYQRAIQERGFPEERATALKEAFEIGLERDGHWAPIVLKDLGLEPIQAFRRVDLPKDQRP